jgi:nicotinate-nucleotide adenylyltransferase
MSKKHTKCSGVSKRVIKPFTVHADALSASKNGIGILGGIFDPLHHGHLAVAALARDYFTLPQILFVPSGRPPHKSTIGASAADRLAMLKLAVRHEPSFTIGDEELKSQNVSYTFDTLTTLRKTFPGRPFYFIVGSDNLHEIETWHCYREVLKMVTLCVAHRPGYSLKPPPSLASARICPFPSPKWGISSTLIRSYLAKGYSCSHLIPECVAEYIRKKNLYGVIR